MKSLDNSILLANHLYSYPSNEALATFLKGFLTEKELAELCMRIAIIRLLKSGKPQLEIAKTLGVGIATVTRGSKELQRGYFDLFPGE